MFEKKENEAGDGSVFEKTLHLWFVDPVELLADGVMQFHGFGPSQVPRQGLQNDPLQLQKHFIIKHSA